MPLDKEAVSVCKTIMRNGYDAYIISARLQQVLIDLTGRREYDVACETEYETLAKLFANVEPGDTPGSVARYASPETGIVYRFYATDTNDASSPSHAVLRVTDNMLEKFRLSDVQRYAELTLGADFARSDGVIEDVKSGVIKLAGIPPLTLSLNYTLAIRALRMAANYELDIDPNTWTAIVQAAGKIAEYVPGSEFVAEWRLVAAENMWRFIGLLHDSTLLHSILPEVAALAAVRQNKGKKNDEEESILEHTIRVMRHYPEGKLPHDWVGLVAVLLHEVGKAYTAESFEGRWTFYQHHRVGAKMARKILLRLHFDPADVDTICGVIRNQVRFQSMLTDRGVRRFLELPDQDRLIELARAIIEAQEGGTYTNFNHNLKYLSRGSTPEAMLEPMLNGNEIMEYTALPPGPKVGLIREALLNAQVLGEVKDQEQAIAFVKDYCAKLEG